MRELRGLTYLAGLTFWRQLWSRKALLAWVMIGLLCLATQVWARRHPLPEDGGPADRSELSRRFANQIVLPMFVSFLLPILSLIPAVSAFGEEREERTLVHLLIRPLARHRVYLAKAVGVLPIVTAIGVLGFALVCWSAGAAGPLAWEHFAVPIARTSIAYGSLFLIFGAVLPRPTVLAIVYAFFGETLLGNMPGTIKRVTISYYCRVLVYDAGTGIQLEPPLRLQFVPVTADTANLILTLATLGLLALGAYAFHRREYRDLA